MAAAERAATPAPRPSLRVVLALESSGPGGAERMLLHLARALRDAGDAPSVATLRPGWMTERAEAAGIPVWLCPQRPGLDWRWVLAFARRLRRERVDVLHAHEFTLNVFGAAAALLARVPVLSTVHGRHWVTDRPRRALAYRVLRRLGVPLVAVSEDLAGFLASGWKLPRAALEVVPNGIPLPPPRAGSARARAEARAALGLPDDGALLVAVGNLYPVKDHATLLRAAARLDGARVAIAGRGGEEERLRGLALELGLGSRLHLLGVRDDVERVLTAADVFVQCSRSEGLPLSLLEAMAAGCPVVVTRVGGMPDAVCEGEAGCIVPPGDPEALATAIGTLLADRARAAALGRAARARAEAEFSVDVMLERYHALYARARSASR